VHEPTLRRSPLRSCQAAPLSVPQRTCTHSSSARFAHGERYPIGAVRLSRSLAVYRYAVGHPRAAGCPPLPQVRVSAEVPQHQGRRPPRTTPLDRRTAQKRSPWRPPAQQTRRKPRPANPAAKAGDFRPSRIWPMQRPISTRPKQRQSPTAHPRPAGRQMLARRTRRPSVH
jgi:hypothetical protein